MSFLRNRVLRRFSIIGRIGDVVLVAGMGLRLAQRKGWISEEQATQFGLAGISESRPTGVAELVLAGAAGVRLLRRKKPSKRR